MLGNVPNPWLPWTHFSLAMVWLGWPWTVRNTNICLKQSQPEFWGSILSLLGCRRKGCCLPASSEGLSLRGAVGAVKGGGTGKKGDKGIKHLDFTAPSHLPCVPRAQALPASFTCWICWCFPEKQPPRALKFFPHLQPFPSRAALWKSCRAEPAACGPWRSPGWDKTDGDLVGGRKTKQTTAFHIKFGLAEPSGVLPLQGLPLVLSCCHLS